MIAVNTRKVRALSSVKSGQTVRLVRISASPPLAGRLAAMGMLPHVEVMVVRNGRTGPCVISVRESKIAIGRGVADKIEVE